MINHKDNCVVFLTTDNVSNDTVSCSGNQQEAESIDSIKVDAEQGFEVIDPLVGGACNTYHVSLSIVDESLAVSLKALNTLESSEKVITKSEITDMLPQGFTEVVMISGSEADNSHVGAGNASDPMFVELYNLYFKEGVTVATIQECPMTSTIHFATDVSMVRGGNVFSVDLTLNPVDTEFATSEVLVA